MSLDEKLTKYSKSGFLPMHMPGHKRNVDLLGDSLPYEKDITEIDGFDDLHHASGILKKIAEQASLLYGSKKSFLLVNGSTCGILAGIRSVCTFSDKVLVARGCHKSVYHAIELNHLNPIYFTPVIDSYGIDCGIMVEEVGNILDTETDIKLIILTSPTYEGVILPLLDIVKIAHQRGVLVLVDEAHGAHLPFLPNLSQYEAIQCGADIVIQSLHKTLPALTQTALLHIQGDVIQEEEVARELAIFETSSPSYLLLDSIECCLNFIENQEKEYFSQYIKNLSWFYQQTKSFKHLKIFGNEHSSFYDLGKIVILTKNTNISGVELADCLRKKYQIEVEMSSLYYVLAMSSVCDSKESLQCLFHALQEIDSCLSFCSRPSLEFMAIIPRKKMTVFEAMNTKNSSFCNFFEAIGKISQEYLWVYPPGVPFLVPGEIISLEIIKKVTWYQEFGIEVRSTYNQFPSIKCF